MKQFLLLALTLWSIAAAGADIAIVAAKPPMADRKPKDVSVHGDPRSDDFFWLRDETNPAVLDYLRAENAYTAAVMAPAQALQEKLYAEMLGRIKETASSLPVPNGKWTYFVRTEKGKQFRIHVRKPRVPADAPEQILLDLNVLAQGGKFIAVQDYQISPDGNRLAYSLDRIGHRDFDLFVLDLRTGTNVPQAVGTVSSVRWAADNDTLFYTKEDPVSKRSCRLGRCGLSTGRNEVLYEEKDTLYDLELSRSTDGKYLLCTAQSMLTTEVRALPADTPQAAWRVLLRREEKHEYRVSHRDGVFYFVSNKGANNFRIVSAPVQSPDEAHWTDFMPHNPAIKIDGIRLFARHAVVSEREGGLPYLRVIDLATRQSHRVVLPEPAYDAAVANNFDYETNQFWFTYTSPVTAGSVFAYDMVARTRTLLKQQEVLGGYSPADYTCERIFAPAGDGTKIPVTLVYRTRLRGAAPRPLVLHGYGSYGISEPDDFSSERLSLLDRGVIFAIAHIRGGGELGEPWREAGRMKNKQTTFSDFIACAEFLVKAGYTTSPQLAITGGSAGGLLIGAVLNQRPDLFKCALAQVPFVDVINTMLDSSVPLTTVEYIEWGNPHLREEYRWMRAYSPYDNITAQAYPAILVTTSLHDSQVPYWEGCKFVAKLRTLKTDTNPLLLKINLDASGHGGASGRYDMLRDKAFDYAFILAELGLNLP